VTGGGTEYNLTVLGRFAESTDCDPDLDGSFPRQPLLFGGVIDIVCLVLPCTTHTHTHTGMWNSPLPARHQKVMQDVTEDWEDALFAWSIQTIYAKMEIDLFKLPRGPERVEKARVVRKGADRIVQRMSMDRD